MKAPPQLYHWFVRPKWVTRKYIHDHLNSRFLFGQASVLDFGCGTGANSPLFTAEQYVGIDPDSSRIRYARRLYPRHSFRVLTGPGLPLPDKSTDYILVIAVLHHISSEDISSYLKEFRRILKPGGTVIVMEPCLSDATPVCNRFMKWYDKGDYIRNEPDYLELFESQDFECQVLQTFKKCFLYHELFFKANLR